MSENSTTKEERKKDYGVVKIRVLNSALNNFLEVEETASLWRERHNANHLPRDEGRQVSPAYRLQLMTVQGVLFEQDVLDAYDSVSRDFQLPTAEDHMVSRKPKPFYLNAEGLDKSHPLNLELAAQKEEKRRKRAKRVLKERREERKWRRKVQKEKRSRVKVEPQTADEGGSAKEEETELTHTTATPATPALASAAFTERKDETDLDDSSSSDTDAEDWSGKKEMREEKKMTAAQFRSVIDYLREQVDVAKAVIEKIMEKVTRPAARQAIEDSVFYCSGGHKKEIFEGWLQHEKRREFFLAYAKATKIVSDHFVKVIPRWDVTALMEKVHKRVEGTDDTSVRDQLNTEVSNLKLSQGESFDSLRNRVAELRKKLIKHNVQYDRALFTRNMLTCLLSIGGIVETKAVTLNTALLGKGFTEENIDGWEEYFTPIETFLQKHRLLGESKKPSVKKASTQNDHARWGTVQTEVSLRRH